METKEVTVFVFYYSCKAFSEIHCINKNDENREKEEPEVLYKKREKRKIRKEMTEVKVTNSIAIISREKWKQKKKFKACPL